MSFIGKIPVTANTYAEIFTTVGLDNTGTYEVLFMDGNATMYLTSDDVSSSNRVSINNASLSTQLKFDWDSAQPLFLWSSNTTSMAIILTKKNSVGLSVNCS